MSLGWLPKTQPSGDPQRRWADLAKNDLTAVKVGEEWYNVAQDRNSRQRLIISILLS